MSTCTPILDSLWPFPMTVFHQAPNELVSTRCSGIGGSSTGVPSTLTPSAPMRQRLGVTSSRHEVSRKSARSRGKQTGNQCTGGKAARPQADTHTHRDTTGRRLRASSHWHGSCGPGDRRPMRRPARPTTDATVREPPQGQRNGQSTRRILHKQAARSTQQARIAAVSSSVTTEMVTAKQSEANVEPGESRKRGQQGAGEDSRERFPRHTETTRRRIWRRAATWRTP